MEKVAKRPERLAELGGMWFVMRLPTYGSVYRGYVQYYKRASNLGWFGHLHWAMYWSLLRTLG